MRINYRILWFEDNKKSYDTKKGFVKDIVEEFGFNFVEPQNEVDGKNIDTLDYAIYDLIIADMNLSHNLTAMKLMEAIRKKDVFTEVLFYSSSGEDAVRKELARYKIDGAYCSDRENDEFEFKVKEVIRTLIKKTQDLTNLRGLVMAEVSDLDVMMGEIVQRYLSQAKENLDRFHCKITRDLEKSLRKKLKKGSIDGATCKKDCTYVWRNMSVTDIVSSVEFESSKKARAVNLVIKDHNFPYTSQSGNFFEDYRAEIIDVRNKLAHCKSEIVNGKEVLIASDGSKEEFGFDRFIKIRKDIKRFRDLFKKI